MWNCSGRGILRCQRRAHPYTRSPAFPRILFKVGYHCDGYQLPSGLTRAARGPPCAKWHLVQEGLVPIRQEVHRSDEAGLYACLSRMRAAGAAQRGRYCAHSTRGRGKSVALSAPGRCAEQTSTWRPSVIQSLLWCRARRAEPRLETDNSEGRASTQRDASQPVSLARSPPIPCAPVCSLCPLITRANCPGQTSFRTDCTRSRCADKSGRTRTLVSSGAGKTRGPATHMYVRNQSDVSHWSWGDECGCRLLFWLRFRPSQLLWPAFSDFFSRGASVLLFVRGIKCPQNNVSLFVRGN